jgi:hypothetical protein
MDSELRSDSNKRDLEKLSEAPVCFLPRRMFENYLLVPEAILFVISNIGGFSPEPVTIDTIVAFIENAMTKAIYYTPGRRPKDKATILEVINGARVLSALFTELSETRVSFQKTKHSVAIFSWLIENSPEELEQIRVLLERILTQSGSSTIGR